MSTLFALLLQGVALLIVLRQVRGRWVSHAGVMFVIMAIVYHGLTEIVQLLFPDRNIFRTLVAQREIDTWLMIISIAILLFSLVYSLTLQLLRRTVKPPALSSASLVHLSANWAPILGVTLVGYFMATSGQNREQLGYWISNSIDQFLLVGIALSSALFLFHSRRSSYVLPVIIIQSAAVAFLGSRLAVFFSLAMLLSTLARFGFKLSQRVFAVMIVLMVIAGISISAARAVVGRATLLGSPSDRLSGLTAGLDQFNFQGVANDFVYRFDGNVFGALVNTRLAEGHPSSGLTSLGNNFFLAVPNFLNPSKLDSDPTVRDEPGYLIRYYDLPVINYLAGTLGIIFGYYGTMGLWVITPVLGGLFAIVDNWLQQTRALLSLLVGLVLMNSVVYYEGGVQQYFLFFRGLLVLYPTLITLSRVHFSVTKRATRLS